MDAEVLRFLAHIDQTRSRMRDALVELDRPAQVALIKTCARGALNELDECERRLVGMLAVVAIFDLVEHWKED